MAKPKTQKPFWWFATWPVKPWKICLVISDCNGWAWTCENLFPPYSSYMDSRFGLELELELPRLLAAELPLQLHLRPPSLHHGAKTKKNTMFQTPKSTVCKEKTTRHVLDMPSFRNYTSKTVFFLLSALSHTQRTGILSFEPNTTC